MRPAAILLSKRDARAGGASLQSESSREHYVAILTEKTWKRHSNPWSVWTRILSYPLVYLPFWNRSWKQGAAVAAWFSLIPLLFPEPKEQQQQQSWATRGV